MHSLLVSFPLSVLFLGSALAQGDRVNVSASESYDVHRCEEGPWGRVLWHYIHLEAPDELLEHIDMPGSQSVWSFLGTPRGQVQKFLINSGLREDVVERLLRSAGPAETTLFPTPEDVLELTDSSRAAIYAELAKYPQNEYHQMPVCILDGSVREWLGKRQIRPELVELIERSVVRTNGLLLFSDPSLLIAKAKGAEEARDMVQLGTRMRAVMAYLEVRPGDDTAALEDYWTAGYKRKDILPILNSLSSLSGGGRLGFGHLLPPEPRKHLYTFPGPAMAARGELPDCLWTSLNFFNPMPRQFYLDPRLAAAEFTESFEKVTAPLEFGDVVMYLDSNGAQVHSCVWLCDQLVYTKNGRSAAAPWMISTLGDVKRLYECTAGASLTIQYLRRKLSDQ